MMHGNRVPRQEVGIGRVRPCCGNPVTYRGNKFAQEQAPIFEGNSRRAIIEELAKLALREDGKRGTFNPYQQAIQVDFHDRHGTPTEQDNHTSGMGSRLRGEDMTTTNPSWIMHPGFYIK